MKGEWKVTCNIFNGEKQYAVYRLRNVEEVDHSGNREFATSYMNDKAEAEEKARKFNAEEKEIRGACGQEEYCCCYNQAKDCCENADCEHFLPLNDFSEEAHKAEFER